MALNHTLFSLLKDFGLTILSYWYLCADGGGGGGGGDGSSRLFI